MRFELKIWIMMLLPLLGGLHLPAQTSGGEAISYSYQDNKVRVTVDASRPRARVDSLLSLLGSSLAQTDSLQARGFGSANESGWVLTRRTASEIVYEKTLQDLRGKPKEKHSIWDLGSLFGEDKGKNGPETRADFGVNVLTLPTIQQTGNRVTFNLLGHEKADQIFLAGSFNDWSTLATPMHRVNGVWTVSVPLDAGKHQYKFIKDGDWILDPANPLQEDDGYGNYNNVYYKTNYTFRLEGFSKAGNVFLAGSFNDWDEDELPMQNVEGSWELPVFLEDGRHEYKFIVDGEWMTDPANPRTQTTAQGYVNSVLRVGTPVSFTLPDFPEAKSVYVIGSFTGWERGKLKMERGPKGWTLDHVLPAGNHYYQFMVEKTRIPDPGNPHRNGIPQKLESVKVVGANHRFSFPARPGVREVLLSGSFNDWSRTGYTMRLENGNWVMDLHLPKGKTLYKFIVNGEWIRDPGNELWEKNEFGSENSVLWVK